MSKTKKNKLNLVAVKDNEAKEAYKKRVIATLRKKGLLAPKKG